MTQTNDIHDVVVIGGGPGGYVAAIRAAQLGLRTALVEKADLGGVCLNWGCIPTKALLRNAEFANLLQHDAAEYGISFDNLQLDYGVAVKRSRRVANRLVRGVGSLMRKNKVTVINGTGVLVAPDTVRVSGEQSQDVRARNVIIATGSHARSLPGINIDGQRILNSDHAVVLEQPPRNLVIMGAGPIGVEFASIFNAYGSQVTVVEMLSQVLPLEDAEVAATLDKSLRRAGIEIRVNTRVEGVELTGDGVEVKVSAEGKADTIVGDKVLVAIGRAPNSEDIGLETVGVAVERGFITVDGQMRTNVPGIYAIGDVTGRQLLAHKAMHEGVVAAEAIAGKDPHPVDYGNVPSCTYCRPQVASVGLTEAKAREEGYEVRVGKFPFQANGKALGLGDYQGFVKLVVDAKYGEILGAHMVGPEVTELIHEIALARATELTPTEIINTIHAHPTLSEAVHEAALGTEDRTIHF
jgi:dihydrolipoamide dehydrogenase